MASVTIDFEFSDDSTDQYDFDADSGLLESIEDYGQEAAEQLNAECDEDGVEIEFEGWSVASTDLDYSEQGDYEEFSDLDAWGEYCEEVEKYGEAYCLRYADIGEFDFDDEYKGEWASEEEFAQNYMDDCMDVPKHLSQYIDYEQFASDLMMDYSSYLGGNGYYIFRS